MPFPLKKKSHREISFSIPEGHNQAITTKSSNVSNVFSLQSVSYSCGGVGFALASCVSIWKRHSCHKSLHHTSAQHHIATLSIWRDKVFSWRRKHVHKPLKNEKEVYKQGQLLARRVLLSCYESLHWFCCYKQDFKKSIKPSVLYVWCLPPRVICFKQCKWVKWYASPHITYD